MPAVHAAPGLHGLQHGTGRGIEDLRLGLALDDLVHDVVVEGQAPAQGEGRGQGHPAALDLAAPARDATRALGLQKSPEMP